jgi:hypothetical protein
MRTIRPLPALFFAPLLAAANVAPTPVIVSAAMRPDSTIMDVVYRVNDPDDTTVKVRALAFINGTRSFTNVIRPTAFVEGTGDRIGDAITTNTDHTLAWDVAVDWDTDVGQLKFEILALDGRGLLQFDWIGIPAAGDHPALTISKDTPASNKTLDAFLWLYASGDPGMSLANGIVTGTAASGAFSGVELANGGAANGNYGVPYLLKQMHLEAASAGNITYANTTARAGLLNPGQWHAVNQPYAGLSIIKGWGAYSGANLNAVGTTEVIAVAASTIDSPTYYGSVALRAGGSVVAWGNSNFMRAIPSGLPNVTAIAAGNFHGLALLNDGTVVGWGYNYDGGLSIPSDLAGVEAISSRQNHNLALKSDGTVVAWGSLPAAVPAGLAGVTGIAAGWGHCLALKNDGTVVGWGGNGQGQITIPGGLTGVTAIAAGANHSLALKDDGTVVCWGYNHLGQATAPEGLADVKAIAAGSDHSLAIKSDGTVVGWGSNSHGQLSFPTGTKASAIAGGWNQTVLATLKEP